MKQIGGVTYIGVSLKDLNKYFKDDAVIHVSKKFLKSYEMISGIAEASKPISMNVIDKTDKIKEPVVEVVKVDTSVPVAVDPLPPVELNMSKGDW
jgi:hypothetical protein